MTFIPDASGRAEGSRLLFVNFQLGFYEAQVEQLPELQLEQALPPVPGTLWGTPLTLVEKAAKVDILRRDGL